MKIYGFWHIAEAGSWKMVMEDQLSKIKSSGLYDATDKIFVTFLGDKIPSCLFDNKFQIYHSKNVLEYEYATLNIMKIMSHTDYFHGWYLHIKSALNNGGSRDSNTWAWKDYMEYYVIEHWKICNNYLYENDLVGTHWQDVPLPHFSGNCYWARSDYIRKLPPVWQYFMEIGGNRLNAEPYIALAPNKHFNFLNSDYNLYNRLFNEKNTNFLWDKLKII